MLKYKKTLSEDIMENSTTVSVCIVTYNSGKKVGETVKTLKQYTVGTDYRLYVFDNGSVDNTKDVVLSADENAVFTETNANLGFGKANNLVIPLMNSKYHAIVNPDIRLDSDVLCDICKYLDENPDTVMATPKILFPDGREQCLPKRKPSFVYLLSRRTPFFKAKSKEYTMEDVEITEPTEIDFCTGCFSVIRSDVFKKLGGFDDRFFMYMEDADLSLRAKEYGKVVFLPQFHVLHEWERSSSKSFKYFMIHISSMIKFLWKHRKSK